MATSPPPPSSDAVLTFLLQRRWRGDFRNCTLHGGGGLRVAARLRLRLSGTTREAREEARCFACFARA